MIGIRLNDETAYVDDTLQWVGPPLLVLRCRLAAPEPAPGYDPDPQANMVASALKAIPNAVQVGEEAEPDDAETAELLAWAQKKA